MVFYSDKYLVSLSLMHLWRSELCFASCKPGGYILSSAHHSDSWQGIGSPQTSHWYWTMLAFTARSPLSRSSQGVQRRGKLQYMLLLNVIIIWSKKNIVNSSWAREWSGRARCSSGFSQELYVLRNCWLRRWTVTKQFNSKWPIFISWSESENSSLPASFITWYLRQCYVMAA